MRPDSRHDSRKNAKRGKRRDEDEDEDGAYGERYRESDKDGGLKKAQAKKAQRKQETAKPQNQLKLPAHISVANLANVFGVRYEAFALTMKNLGFEDARHNYVLSSEDAGLIAMEFGYQPVFDKSTVELIASPWPEDKTSLPARPPVVTIMGHVDHGKTTILDYLRKSSVAAHEHGGITQHIGAFSVSMASGKKITFLDTPGHAAFLSMRQRGANVTDIVILVVAADDGIMPQTIEAIKHAQAAQVPIIVAINKVDKPEKNITRIMQELARHNVEPEEFGGDTQVVHVSGKTGHGMPDLEEAIVTLSEILDHRAPLDGAVEGWVLESAVKPSRGKVATVLVRRGTLRPGDVVVAGTAWARARTLRDAAGLAVREAGPGTPVELDGWRQRPAPGDEVLQSPAGERAAAAVVESRAAMADMARLAKDVAAANAVRQQGAAADGDEAAGASKEERHRDRAIDGVFVEKSPQGVAAGKGSSTGGALDVHFVVKADVVGSVEAATNLIAGLGDGRTVRASVVRAQAGPVSESDIELASCAGTGGASGVVLAFNAGVERGARDLAARRGVQVLEHSIIYRIAEDVVKLMESRLPDIVSWKVLGDGLVFATDKYTVKGRKTKRIAGVKVKSGTLVSGGMVRVMRKAEVIYDGEYTCCSVICAD
jgi:translation initiation factor IF-2